MVDANSMRSIIKNTLEAMEGTKHVSESEINLVELTFLMESNMERLVSGNKHGLMGWTFNAMERFISERAKINKRFAQDINNIALIDVHEDSLDDIFEACSYNLALQVLLTYQFYRSEVTEMPIGVEAVANAYLEYWPNAKGNAKEASKKVASWANYITTKGRLTA